MKLLPDQEKTQFYNVRVSRNELLLIAAIGGSIGGPARDRVGFHLLMDDIRTILGLGITYWREATEELAVYIDGASYIEEPNVSTDL
jgi:hypothetical protein